MLEWFEEWHVSDEKYSNGIHSADTNWLEVYANRDKFMQMTEECGAPVDMQALIWEALQSTSDKLDTERGGRRCAYACRQPSWRSLP